MKKSIFFLLMSFAITVQIFAQNKQVKAVETQVEKLRNAMINADTATLLKITNNKLSYGHSGGHVDTQQEFIHKIATGNSDFVTMDLTEQTISVTKKTAIVRHNLNAKTNDNNKPNEVHLKVMLVWQKLKGSWILVARQAVKA
jgi:ketosteroid isomerase-like protein